MTLQMTAVTLTGSMSGSVWMSVGMVRKADADTGGRMRVWVRGNKNANNANASENDGESRSGRVEETS